MEVFSNVEIAAVRGGYVVKASELEPLTQEWQDTVYSCSSINEVVRRVIHALESADKWEPKDYDRIEKQLNG